MCSGSAPYAKPLIVALGDSLTDGYGLEKSLAYPARLEEKLRTRLPMVKVINGGISGSTTAGAEKRLRWFLKQKPDILILGLGANDGLRGVPIETTKKNLSQVIDLAQANKMKVLLLGMKLPINYGEKYRKQFEAMYRDLAKRKSITLMPFMLEGVAAQPDLNLPDQIHPNEKGHVYLADNILKYLEKLLP